MVEIVEII